MKTKIESVKIFELCSKHRKKEDRIPKDINGRLYEDNEISCIMCDENKTNFWTEEEKVFKDFLNKCGNVDEEINNRYEQFLKDKQAHEEEIKEMDCLRIEQENNYFEMGVKQEKEKNEQKLKDLTEKILDKITDWTHSNKSLDNLKFWIEKEFEKIGRLKKFVKLKEERPFRYKEVFTFFKKDSQFEVIEEKILPLIGLCYKLKSVEFNIELDGFSVSKDFEEI